MDRKEERAVVREYGRTKEMSGRQGRQAEAIYIK